MQEQSFPLQISCPCHDSDPPYQCKIAEYQYHPEVECPLGKTTTSQQRQYLITSNLDVLCCACKQKKHIKDVKFFCRQSNQCEFTTSTSLSQAIRSIPQGMNNQNAQKQVDFIATLKKALFHQKWANTEPQSGYEKTIPLYILCPCHDSYRPDQCLLPTFLFHPKEQCPNGKTTSNTERSYHISTDLYVICQACDQKLHLKKTQFFCAQSQKYQFTTPEKFMLSLVSLEQIILDAEEYEDLEFIASIKKKLLSEKW